MNKIRCFSENLYTVKLVLSKKVHRKESIKASGARVKLSIPKTILYMFQVI